MSTHFADHLISFNAEAARILKAGEIGGVPSDNERPDEAERFIKTMTALAGAMDRFFSAVILDADEHVGAMTAIERKDCQHQVRACVDNELEWPFRRFVEGIPPASGTIARHPEALTPRQVGVTVGRGL